MWFVLALLIFEYAYAGYRTFSRCSLAAALAGRTLTHWLWLGLLRAAASWHS
jgi:hypothetical protein